MKKLFWLALILSLILLLALPLVALATPLPTIIEINSIEVYQHYGVLNSQIYVVVYTLTTTDNSSSAQDLYMFRLAKEGVILGSTVPYAYYENGYGSSGGYISGVATIFFSADVPPPTWHGDYAITFEGNPLESWDGARPYVSSSEFNKWSSSTTVTTTSFELRFRILYLAHQLALSWGQSLTETISGITVLNAYGEGYFTTIFPNLRMYCPELFLGSTGNPIPDIPQPTGTVVAERAAKLIGTPFDFTGIADFLGIGRMWITGFIWTLFSLVTTGMASWKMKSNRITLFVFGFLMLAGAALNFHNWIAAALMGLLGVLAIVYNFMWRQSTE